jgi:hypothetical protein
MGERVPIGADHAGFELKERLKTELENRGLEPVDVGAHSTESVDYPDFAKQVAASVSAGEAQRGVLMCGTGLGMSYTANRFPGVRAAVAWTPEIAELLTKGSKFSDVGWRRPSTAGATHAVSPRSRWRNDVFADTRGSRSRGLVCNSA